MRYLLIILIIFSCATALTLYSIWPETTTQSQDVVVTINGHPLTRDDIQHQLNKDTHHNDSEDLLNTIISRQLLITEAQRQNIDKEKGFRDALKTFYEHSLIKILMDRMDSSITVEVSDIEIDRYIKAYGKIFTFYTLKTSSEVKKQDITDQGEKSSEPFENLGESLQYALAPMKSGEISSFYFTGNEKYAIYLENISGGHSNGQNIDKDNIHQTLIQIKKEEKINKWIELLRHNAEITFSTMRN